MDKQEWISQLGRIYTEVESVEGGTGAQEHVDQFNRVLSKLKSEFPDNEFVQGTESITVSKWGQSSANQEVKMKCGQLADALGHDVPEKRLESEGDITVISMATEQSNEQSMSQEVSIDQVIEMVNYTALGEAEKKELQDVVHQFEDELEGDRDPNTLRKLISKAEKYSTDTAAKLAMLALQKGVTAVLNLG
jgi:hypothetical protein